jgi:hypothetical protein
MFARHVRSWSRFRRLGKQGLPVSLTALQALQALQALPAQPLLPAHRHYRRTDPTDA